MSPLHSGLKTSPVSASWRRRRLASPGGVGSWYGGLRGFCTSQCFSLVEFNPFRKIGVRVKLKQETPTFRDEHKKYTPEN